MGVLVLLYLDTMMRFQLKKQFYVHVCLKGNYGLTSQIWSRCEMRYELMILIYAYSAPAVKQQGLRRGYEMLWQHMHKWKRWH